MKILVTKEQHVECCGECFLYDPDHDMSATIPACRELYEREENSDERESYSLYLKFKKGHNENNSIALNCPFRCEQKEKIEMEIMYQLRPLAQSKKVDDYIIEKVPKHDLEEPPTALTYFYFHDTINHFSSLGLLRKNASKIKEGLRDKQKIFIKQNGDMRIKGRVYSGAFKPFFEFATKKPDPINVPKNEGEGVYIIPTDFQTEKNIN